MPSRQDQLHSYQYSLQRVVAALVTHDPDPARSPLRRAGTTALVSLLIASIAVVGSALYGFLTGQSGVDPNDPKVLFQEKGTGARYVYLASDEKLHPVLNYTSGLLLTDADAPDITSVSASSLASVPLGATLGIPGAPDSLPSSKSDMIGGLWSVCTSNDSSSKPQSTLLIGDQLSGGTNPTAANPQDSKAILVQDTAKAGDGTDPTIWLVWNNRKFQFPEKVKAARATKSAFGWADQSPWDVAPGFINAIPSGPDLKAVTVSDPGRPSDKVPGFKVGDLVTDGQQFGLILDDGMAPITQVQARLVEADGGVTAQKIDNFTSVTQSGTTLSDTSAGNNLPSAVPSLVATRPSRACFTQAGDKTASVLRLDMDIPTGVHVADINAAGEDSKAVKADLVHVDRGKVAVVEAQAHAGATAGSGAVGVVTDAGLLYTLGDRTLIGKLGLSEAPVVSVPASMMGLIADGPALTTTAAAATYPPAPTSSAAAKN